jgi:integral membrane protein
MPKWFQVIGRLEGISFLILLIIAMPLKYYAHWPAGVKVMGPLHGTLFLLYCASVLIIATSDNWSAKKQVLAFVAAILPCGTFVFEKRYS